MTRHNPFRIPHGAKEVDPRRLEEHAASGFRKILRARCEALPTRKEESRRARDAEREKAARHNREEQKKTPPRHNPARRRAGRCRDGAGGEIREESQGPALVPASP